MPARERTGIICLAGNEILAIEQQDPTTHKRFWTFPGGALEGEESPEQGAIRETLEETGYLVNLSSSVYTNRYQFLWNAKRYDCTTHWFLATWDGTDPQPVADADYILQTRWLPWPESRGLFTFNVGLTDAIRHLLDHRSEETR